MKHEPPNFDWPQDGAAPSRSGVWNLRPEVSSGQLIYDGSVDPNFWSVAAWRGGGNWVVVFLFGGTWEVGGNKIAI